MNFCSFKKLLGAIVLILLLVFSQVTSVLALEPGDPLPDTEKKALRDYPHHVLSSCAAGSESADVSLRGSKNAEQAFNFFLDKGLTKEQAAGIVGNMEVESGVDPQNIQNPQGRTKDPSNISAGWGIIQWTKGSKIIGIAEKQGVTGPIYELSTQLEIVWNHMKGESPTGQINMLEHYKTVTDAGQAAIEFEEKMEGAGAEVHATRAAAAKAALRKYGDSTAVADASGSTSSGCQCTASGSASSSDELSKTLKSLAEKNGGKTMLSVSSVDGTIEGNSGGDEQMPTRSSYKLYTAYATLKAIEAGKISWSTTIWNGNSVSETMSQMIIQSNNDAAEALRTDSRIGTHTQVTKLLHDQVGLSDQTVMGSGNANDPKGTNTVSTANDFVKFLVLLEKHKLPGVSDEKSYTKLIDLMKQATTDGTSARAGIAAGVGKSTDVADKPGWGPAPAAASNDVGIVYLADNPYVVAILTDTPSKWTGVESTAKAIHQAMGGTLESSGDGSDCSAIGGQGLVETVKQYAHPVYHAAPFLERKPAYADAVTKAKAAGIYSGGSVKGVEGIDCGGFVTLLMINSGYEPNYNSKGKGGNTDSQMSWLEDNWQKIDPKSTKDMQPGDVAVNHTHTYVYVGKISGFHSSTASASYDRDQVLGRAPMAGHEAPADPKFNWYRKK